MSLLEHASPWPVDEMIEERRNWPRMGAIWTTQQYEPPHTYPLGESTGVGRRLQPWLRSAAQTIERLARYPDNWNGYGERRITPRAVDRAIRLLAIVALSDSPSPSAIVPVANGGLQLEWGDTGDVTVEVFPSGEAEGYHVDKDATWQLREGADFAQLIRYIAQHA